MEWLVSLLREFKDFIFRPFTLLAFGGICLTLLLLREPYLVRIGFDSLVKEHKTAFPIATAIFLVAGIIRFWDIHIYSRWKRRKEQKRQKEDFRRRLDNWLSKQELLILTYCLSRNRSNFFVLKQEQNLFADAVSTLTAKGYFRPLPSTISGIPHYITEDNWTLLQHFRGYVIDKGKALSPTCEKEFQYYDQYQKQYGFEQTGIPEKLDTAFTYTMYTKDKFFDVLWKWEYKIESGETPVNLAPYCPRCERQLDPNAVVSYSDNEKHSGTVVCSFHNETSYDVPTDGRGNYPQVIAIIADKLKSENRSGKSLSRTSSFQK